jgi:hypothetical protein
MPPVAVASAQQSQHIILWPIRRTVILFLEKQYNVGAEPMKSVDLMYQTMLAVLGQRPLDAAGTADFPPEGWFTPANIKGRKYWYFDIPDGHGGTKRRCVGLSGSGVFSSARWPFSVLQVCWACAFPSLQS